MGSCCSVEGNEEREDDNDIKHKMQSSRQAEEQKHKLLLLGAGESGKSTLLKQMKQIHGEQFTADELAEAKPHIVQNLVESMRVLAIYSDLLGENEPDTKVHPDNEEVRTRVAMLSDKHTFGPAELHDFEQLWADKGIRETLALKANFQIIDTAEYLFDNMAKYALPDYQPTFDDLIHSRRRTTGVNKISFKIVNEDKSAPTEVYEVFDVGGQRNERRKWIHFFDNVAAIIFVAALSGYNQTLWEDNRQNRMHEALALFESIMAMECFEQAHMILFLNKEDLFEEKIKKIPLHDFFDEFTGKPHDKTEAIAFIQNEFVKKRGPGSKIIYAHVTNATNRDNVFHVFDSVRDTVVRRELGKAGLL